MSKSPTISVSVMLVALVGLVGADVASPSKHADLYQPSDTIEDLRRVGTMLERYRGWSGEYPEQLMHLSALFQFIDRESSEFLFTDSWGAPFVYRRTDVGLELYSLGKDGVDNELSGDDLHTSDDQPLCEYYESFCQTLFVYAFKSVMAVLLGVGACMLLIFYATTLIRRVIGHAT